ncbi:transketolase C-terminal domain-containing protein [Lachnospiraceae bacterium 62-35]
MEINKKNIKKFAVTGARPTLGRVLQEAAERDKNICVITADVSTSAGLERYKKSLPEQYIDVGIAEQNMMSIAAGLAKEGFRVVTTSFAPFQSMRCLEQIRVNYGYMELPVVMVGLASGIYHSYLGNTHCCFEDVAILRSIPNIAVVTPADGAEIVKAVESALTYKSAVYIRLIENKGLPIVYEEDFDFAIGKANLIRDGRDIAIIANGTMVHASLELAKLLEKNGISSKIVDMHTVKPLDTEMLDRLCEHQLIVTIEEHNIIGGLGSAVAEYLAPKRKRPRQLLFGIHDFYPHAGNYEDALEQCGLLPSQMLVEILKEMKE